MRHSQIFCDYIKPDFSFSDYLPSETSQNFYKKPTVSNSKLIDDTCLMSYCNMDQMKRGCGSYGTEVIAIKEMF